MKIQSDGQTRIPEFEQPKFSFSKFFLRRRRFSSQRNLSPSNDTNTTHATSHFDFLKQIRANALAHPFGRNSQRAISLIAATAANATACFFVQQPVCVRSHASTATCFRQRVRWGWCCRFSAHGQLEFALLPSISEYAALW
jgi:hypothetical protein